MGELLHIETLEHDIRGSVLEIGPEYVQRSLRLISSDIERSIAELAEQDRSCVLVGTVGRLSVAHSRLVVYAEVDENEASFVSCANFMIRSAGPIVQLASAHEIINQLAKPQEDHFTADYLAGLYGRRGLVAAISYLRGAAADLADMHDINTVSAHLRYLEEN